ncbi:hypothetical protein OBE_09585, partial [human gut metagenome]
IITQMLFSENIFDEEKIFEDYYLSDTAYFRLKQAYLAFVFMILRSAALVFSPDT